MLGNLIKRKLDPNKLSNVFVNSLMEATENGFSDVKAMINDDPAFIRKPQIHDSAQDHFLLIVVVGNLRFLNEYFEVDEAREVKRHIMQKFANVFDMDAHSFEAIIKEYDQFLCRVNHPSKNILYGMSKALFFKLELNTYQENYFKNMKTPNPLFLKRIDEVMMNFLWDWDELFKKYKMQFA